MTYPLSINEFFKKRKPIKNAEYNYNRLYNAPPFVQPDDLFYLQIHRGTIPAPRYIHHNDPGTMLMFIDGSALNNGRPYARAGFSVVFRKTGNISARLERPPNGQAPTSNRAELRAAICALGLRHWRGEGFVRIVLACDSEYVVLGACERLAKWRRNGWMTCNGSPVKNRDLWEILLQELMRWEELGIKVLFWRIPRHLNTVADKLAKEGANIPTEPRGFTRVLALDLPITNPNSETESEGENEALSGTTGYAVETTGYAAETTGYAYHHDTFDSPIPESNSESESEDEDEVPIRPYFCGYIVPRGVSSR